MIEQATEIMMSESGQYTDSRPLSVTFAQDTSFLCDYSFLPLLFSIVNWKYWQGQLERNREKGKRYQNWSQCQLPQLVLYTNNDLAERIQNIYKKLTFGNEFSQRNEKFLQ